MVGDGLEDELGGCLLWESVPVRETQLVSWFWTEPQLQTTLMKSAQTVSAVTQLSWRSVSLNLSSELILCRALCSSTVKAYGVGVLWEPVRHPAVETEPQVWRLVRRQNVILCWHPASEMKKKLKSKWLNKVVSRAARTGLSQTSNVQHCLCSGDFPRCSCQ